MGNQAFLRSARPSLRRDPLSGADPRGKLSALPGRPGSIMEACQFGSGPPEHFP